MINEKKQYPGKTQSTVLERRETKDENMFCFSNTRFFIEKNE